MTLSRDRDRTEMVVHVEVPTNLADDGLPGWWAYARDGWRDTIERLAAELAA